MTGNPVPVNFQPELSRVALMTSIEKYLMKHRWSTLSVPVPVPVPAASMEVRVMPGARLRLPRALPRD